MPLKKHKKSANNIEYITISINAMNVPENLKGLRTQFLSLHHFRPNDAKQILQNAIDTQSTIAIFEAQERNLKSIIFMLFSPINVLLMTPFIKPFKIGRVIFTYLIPILPLLVLWDGLVSVLRTYSPKELDVLINDLENCEGYTWEIDRIKSGPSKIIYLLGYPNN